MNEKTEHPEETWPVAEPEAGDKEGTPLSEGACPGGGPAEEGLKAQLDALQTELDGVKERELRVMAEYDNFRKRTQKEKEQLYQSGMNDALREIIPILDNLDRALLTSTGDENVHKGIEMTYNQCKAILEKLGVLEIEAQGAPFDPQIHNAVMHVEDPDLPQNVVAEVLQKGYEKDGQVLRHAVVKVAN